MKALKRIVSLALLAIMLGTLLYSCKSAESCPAYGEAKKFQIERR